MMQRSDDLAAPSWAAAQEGHLLDFAAGSRLAGGGFGWLGDGGETLPDEPLHTYVNARMTYVFSVAALRGRNDLLPLVDHGLAALRRPLRDPIHGGWFPSAPHAGHTPTQKTTYDHAFVLLASAAATAAGRPSAAALLEEVGDVILGRLWSAEQGLAVDSCDRGWRHVEPYRGANANMHLVEAFLATADATGDRVWRDRALGIAERLVHTHAEPSRWRLPEHFDSDWQVLPEHNRDRPADPFRPYGSTVGHWLEWARLLVQLHLAGAPRPWLIPTAEALLAAAADQGWGVDGAPGLVYTVDADGRPVVRTRMHWVHAEAIAAASMLGRVTGNPAALSWLPIWADFVRDHFLDQVGGSWHHELSPDNRPASGTWRGKPDIYHAYQSVVLMQAPPAGSLILATTPGGR